LSGVSAREHHHYSRAAHLTAHHVMPMAASTGGVGFGQTAPADGISGMAAAQASAAGVPVSLVERVIRRESGGNPRAVHAGNYGLMQIKLGTARAMGYTGSAEGLLDPQTNMTYAVRYLAGAYRAAGGNEGRAVALYASGYYTQAKARGFSPYASASRVAP
jgi:soluble lytic murein transglycosylase-like protein